MTVRRLKPLALLIATLCHAFRLARWDLHRYLPQPLQPDHIRHIAQAMTLFPGDLIPSGTPSGVSPVVAGDNMEVTVEGVGTLRNPVADE